MLLLKATRRFFGANFSVLSQTSNSTLVQVNNQKYVLSTLAADYLQDKGIDLSKILGSGDKGKITIHDVKRFEHPKVFKNWNEVLLQDKSLNLQNYRSTLKPLIEPHKGKDLVEEGLDKLEMIVHVEKKSEDRPGTFEQNSSENPKYAFPQYTLTRKINVTNAVYFVKQINVRHPTIGLSLSDVIIKAVHLASLDNPTVYQYYLGNRLYKTNILFVKYANHFDPTKNRLIRMNRVKNLKQYQQSNLRSADDVSIFNIEDCGSYPVTEIKPIIKKNNVN